MVAEIFNRVGGPVELDALVNLLALLLDVKDQPSVSLDAEDAGYWEQHLADRSFRPGSQLEARETLRRLWNAVRQLPPAQRDTFCLGFEDEEGTHLFSLLIDAELVTPGQLAQELGRSLEQQTLLWRQMPMGNAAIADALGATRQQVIKWRFHALRKLEKMMLAPDAK